MDTIANSTVPAGSTEQWRDPKRYLWLIGLVVPSLFFLGYGGWLLTGWPGLFWIGPVVILVIVPAIDLFAGLDRSNPPDDVIEALEQDRYYRWITYLFLPIQYVGFVAAMYLIARGDPLGIGGELPLWAKVGLAVSIGCIGGIGINTAHELGHKKESNERWLSKIALAQSFYGHFYIEHNRGHHVRVATPGGPGQQPGGRELLPVLAAHGRRLRQERVAHREAPLRPQEAAPVPHRQRRAQRLADVAGAVGRAVAWLGVGILPYLVIQAVVGFSLLEVVNYMEHYGMLRQKVGVGERQRYERVDPSHSWNSNNIATNVLLYHLQRHSDHHANPTRRYQSLRDYEESPVLPTGYAGMIVLSIVPAVWRRVMDPRVLHHFDGDLSLANLSPRKRDRILAKYPPPGRTTSWCRRRAVGRAGGARSRCSPRSARAAATSTRSRPATSTRASRPARPGRTCPTAGAAPTAGSATRSTSSRWTGSRPADSATLAVMTVTTRPLTMRERVIDAAVNLTTEVGWAQVTMARLADVVGVSRQTVYNEIGTKPRLAEAMILRELERFLGLVTAAFDAHPTDLVGAIRDASRAVLEASQDNPLLQGDRLGHPRRRHRAAAAADHPRRRAAGRRRRRWWSSASRRTTWR